MEWHRRAAWKPCVRRYKRMRLTLRIAISILIAIMFLYPVYFYWCREKINSPEIHHLYTDCENCPPIVECVEPSYEIKKPNQYLSVSVPGSRSNVPKPFKQKLLLLWTKYFDSDYADDYCFFLPGNTTFASNKCPESDCLATNNRSLLMRADALIFHQSDFDLNDLPSYRNSNQIWIFYTLESPARVRNNWKKMNRLFNWTMTYREDSDVVVKYGEICKLPPTKQTSQKKNYLQNKTKEVVWFVSDCYTSSNRERYVEELSKYIGVDIYGKCGTLSCLPGASLYCYQKVLKDYKFYLSFENSICKDYATEKLYNILNNDIVPVVMGGGNYQRIAPPNSFINIFDFDSPKELATYLKEAETYEFLYNSYFEWKGKYKIYLVPWMCDLCEKLHAVKPGSSKIVDNMHEWWFEKAHCTIWRGSGYEYLNKCL